MRRPVHSSRDGMSVFGCISPLFLERRTARGREMEACSRRSTEPSRNGIAHASASPTAPIAVGSTHGKKMRLAQVAVKRDGHADQSWLHQAGCGGGTMRLICTPKKLKVFSFFVAKAPHHVGVPRFHRYSVRRTGGLCTACALRSQRDRHRAALRLHPFDRRPRAGHRTNSVRACARLRMEFSSRREPDAHASADDDGTCIALSPTDDRVSEYRWRTTARHRAHVPTARTDRDNTANRQSPRADASDQPSRRAFAMSPEPRATGAVTESADGLCCVPGDA